MASDEVDFRRLAALSRQSAIVGGLGAILVLAAIGYSSWQLNEVQGQRDVVAAQRDAIASDLRALADSVEVVGAELAGARCALASSRAAINAFHDRRYAMAVALYDEALVCDPGNGYLLNLKAYSLFKLGDLTSAIATQQQSVAAEPDYAWGHFDLARFLCANGELDAASDAFGRAIRLRQEMATIAQGDVEFQRVCQGRLGA
jgi:tetratricopeptide (TPR) repeat protein